MHKVISLVFLLLLGCKSEDESCEGDTLTLSGTVYGMDGNPFEGANVIARGSETDDTPDEEARDATHARTADITTVTDESGAYSLTVSVGDWSVWAWMEGYEDTGISGGFGCESETLLLTASDCTDVSQDFIMDSCHYDD